MDRKEAIEYWEEFLEEIPEIEGMPQEEKDKQEQATLMAIAALQEPEIVHCKDCRLRKTEECAMQYECDCGEQHSWENDNDYCSWGIKAGEQNG